MKLFKTIQKQEKTVGHKSNGAITATGGYKKVGQLCLNGLTHIVLGVRDAGVVADTVIGDVDQTKAVLVNHEANKVEAYRLDLKNLKKELKKTKKKSLRKDLAADIRIVKESVSFYESKLAKARKL